MRALVVVLGAAAAVASTAWSAALPPGALGARAQPISRVRPGPFPKPVRSPLGQERILTEPPRRIVSIALGADEMLLALVAPERLVGVTYLIDRPELTASSGLAPASARRVTEEPESLLALSPDLVVVAGYTRADTIVLLEQAGVTVMASGEHQSLDDVLAALDALGQAVGEPARASALEDALRQRIHAVQDRAHRGRRSRVLLWEGGYTFGAGTLQDDLIDKAGGSNVAAEAGMKGPSAMTEEAALGLGADVVLVPIASNEPRWNDPALLGTAPIWQSLDAVRAGRVYGVPNVWMGSVSQHVVRALESIAAFLDDSAR